MMVAWAAAVMVLCLCSPVAADFHVEGTNCWLADWTSMSWPVIGGTRGSQPLPGVGAQRNACRGSQLVGVTRTADVVCSISLWGQPVVLGEPLPGRLPADMGQGPAPVLVRSASSPDPAPVASATYYEVSYFCFHVSLREDSELFQSVRDDVSRDMLAKIKFGQVSGPGSSGWGILAKRDPAAAEAYIQAFGSLSSGAACWSGACFHLYMSSRLQHTCSVTRMHEPGCKACDRPFGLGAW